MHPLVFLTVRSLVNGVKRALTSGKRLIGLLFFAGYYFWLVFRPMGDDRQPRFQQPLPVNLPVPALWSLDAFVFGLFAFFSFLLVMNVLGYRGGFRQADVDVLFPTPVSARIVLVFRIVRDYLLTLLLPLFFAILGWQGVGSGINFFRSRFSDEQVTLTFRAMTVSWILLALCWVSIGYAASLFVNRSDLQSDRNKRIIGYSIGAILIGVTLYIGINLRAAPSWETAGHLAHSMLLRTVFFTSTAATALVMAPLENDLLQGVLGLGSMLAIIVASFWIAMTQVDWLYDQAAARGFDTQNYRSLRQKGDIYGILAEQARQGKIRQGRLARRVSRWRPKGGMALLWKDLILQARSSMWSYAIFLPISIFIVTMPVWSVAGSGIANSTLMYYIMQGAAIFMMSMSANSGVIEMLRRVDVQKPLPFSPGVTVFWEVASKAIPPTVISWIAGLVVLVLLPPIWPSFVATALMAPPLSFLLVSVVYLVTILFPDVDDPTQRGFRSLMLLLALAVLGSPAVLFFIFLYAVGLPPYLVAVGFFAINAVITLGVSAISGGLYANFNPSE